MLVGVQLEKKNTLSCLYRHCHPLQRTRCDCVVSVCVCIVCVCVCISTCISPTGYSGSYLFSSHCPLLPLSLVPASCPWVLSLAEDLRYDVTVERLMLQLSSFNYELWLKGVHLFITFSPDIYVSYMLSSLSLTSSWLKKKIKNNNNKKNRSESHLWVEHRSETRWRGF